MKNKLFEKRDRVLGSDKERRRFTRRLSNRSGLTTAEVLRAECERFDDESELSDISKRERLRHLVSTYRRHAVVKHPPTVPDFAARAEQTLGILASLEQEVTRLEAVVARAPTVRRGDGSAQTRARPGHAPPLRRPSKAAAMEGPAG